MWQDDQAHVELALAQVSMDLGPYDHLLSRQLSGFVNCHSRTDHHDPGLTVLAGSGGDTPHLKVSHSSLAKDAESSNVFLTDQRQFKEENSHERKYHDSRE